MRYKMLCLDIDGTITDGIIGSPLPGAVEAVKLLQQKLPVRFVTNATSASHATLAQHLASLGFLSDPTTLTTPISTAQRVLTDREQHSGLLLVDESNRAAFDWFKEDPDGPAVLLATEGHALTISQLQPAFRRLLGGAQLYTLQQNRYFRCNDELVTDLGPVMAFLEYGSGAKAENFGKPAPLLFDVLAASAKLDRSDLLMVGDDVEFDASASVALGMGGIVVRTGKYRPQDENRVSPPPTDVIDSIADLPGWIDGQQDCNTT